MWSVKRKNGSGGTTKVSLSLQLAREMNQSLRLDGLSAAHKPNMNKTTKNLSQVSIEDLSLAGPSASGKATVAVAASNLPQIYPQASVQNLQELNVNMMTA